MRTSITPHNPNLVRVLDRLDPDHQLIDHRMFRHHCHHHHHTKVTCHSNTL